MAQQHDDTLVTVAIIGGVALLAWKLGFFGQAQPAAPVPSTGITTITPATPSIATGGTSNNNPSDANGDLELFANSNYAGQFWRGNGTSGEIANLSELDGAESIGSVRSHGGIWMLYAEPNLTGNSVSTGGLDYAYAPTLLSSLNGVIGSAKYLGHV